MVCVVLSKCSSIHKSVDYPGIGFFDTDGLLDYLPEDPFKMEPSFYLYTRENPTEAEVLLWNNTESVESSRYYSNGRPTKVIIHGYVETPASRPWIGDMKDKFLEAFDLNVIIIDWSKNRANRGRYGQAAANTQVIGPMVAIQVQLICRLKNATESQFHLIGQSLGAHLSGFAGKFLNGTLGQITGMDPAGPSFEGAEPQYRLWYTDAQFVDAIHTDMRPVIGLGMGEACGTIDIYPNSGHRQPGCGTERLSSFMRGFLTGARTLIACEHYRSWKYFTESITNVTNPKLLAHRCENYELFEAGNCNDCGDEGQNCAWFGPRSAEFKAKGENRIKFYLNTAETEPYFQ
ncbi:PREDICTED: inactive pancreatic lipase-related protein 1-like [Rhagoletis zephyria]|uniref:inactive pancreatic lipase-related protein 1-like n=1 Tax=Rhagoletis zephyria TaxID=28612 RepID=UPI00081134FD|nr:PREDICTED: inactive pancreatic lipase-related protein 1-like [Rhagoletis zephyria]